MSEKELEDRAAAEEEMAAKGAAITLLLDGLKPGDLHDVLLAGGIYAPAVSSTQYIYDILDEIGAPANKRQQMLNDIRIQVMSFTRDVIRDVGRDYRGDRFLKPKTRR